MSEPARLGGMSTSRPATRDAIHSRDLLLLPAGSIIAPNSPLELGEVSQSALDERELSSCLFFCGFLSLVAILLVASYCALVSFVPQTVEYQVGVKADRLEGHR